MAKRAQGAQQIVSGLLADPSLIDPKKKQTGLLAWPSTLWPALTSGLWLSSAPQRSSASPSLGWCY